MKHPGYIYDELKEIAPFLAELEKSNILSVPQNYFSGLAAQVITNTKKNTFSILPASAANVLTTPEGYFENLSNNILQKIRDQESGETGNETEDEYPTLYSASNENVFTIPAGYFDRLPTIILSRANQKAKVFVMQKRSMFWNCAVAAMITGVMAICSLWISNTSLNQDATIAGITSTPSDVSDALRYKNEQEVNEGIAALSDADIIKYLQITGDDVDDEALSSGIQEKGLPAEEDYLTDENTLQNFLGKIQLQDNQN